MKSVDDVLVHNEVRPIMTWLPRLPSCRVVRIQRAGLGTCPGQRAHVISVGPVHLGATLPGARWRHHCPDDVRELYGLDSSHENVNRSCTACPKMGGSFAVDCQPTSESTDDRTFDVYGTTGCTLQSITGNTTLGILLIKFFSDMKFGRCRLQGLSIDTHRLLVARSRGMLANAVYNDILAVNELLQAIPRAVGMVGDPPAREGLPSIPHRTLAQNAPDAFDDDDSFVDDILERVLDRNPAGASSVAHVVSRFSCELLLVERQDVTEMLS